MARISYTVNGQTSCTLSVTELNTTTTYASVYISCNGSRSGNLAYVGSKVYTSKSWTVTGLSAGTTYTASFEITSAGGSKATGSTNFRTESAPAPIVVGGVGTVYVSNSGAGAISVSWSRASNATEYRVEVYNAYGTMISSNNVTSTSTTVSGLAQGTFYEVKVFGRRTGSSNGTPSYGSITTESYEVGSISSLSVVASTSVKGRISMSWSSATNATGYRWEIYIGNTTSSSNQVANGSTTSTSDIYSGLSEYTLYTVKVYGYRSGYSNGSPRTATVTTIDLTPPVISNLEAKTDGRMYISFSASDYQSGLRSSNRFYTQISSKNGTTYGNGAFSNNMYRTFTEDASGNEFEHNAYYYMKVTAYDNQGNSSYSEVRAQFKKGRPIDWSWHTTKVKGNVISLTASEWNSFCLRINQFRQYKNFDNYNFTNVTRGDTITASIVNQARSAILSMTPPSSVPASAVAKSTVITASYFNSLSMSLNSIK